jgi:hypothetical protein
MTDPVPPVEITDRRESLDAILREIVGDDGTTYFQPPANISMQYPCIVYERDNASLKSADNVPYAWTQRYQVTVIDHNPDSGWIQKVAALPMSSFSRHFATSGLNHDVFVLYH